MGTYRTPRKELWGTRPTVADDLSPAHQRGDDDTPGSAAAVGARLLGVRVGVRGVVALAPPAAEPEGVEEQEEEVQAQAEHRHGTEEQDGLRRDE